MKVERVTLRHVRMALRTPFETSFGRIANRDCILLEMVSEGLVGYGECVADRDPGYSYETVQTAFHVLKDFILPDILGSEPITIQNYMEKARTVRGHPMAKAGVEMALWDLAGKREGKSLSQLLGGVRPRVMVGVSVGIQENPHALVKVVEGYLNQGYGRIKIKIKPGRDVKDTQAVRDAFPNIRLQVDANSAYSLETATTLLPLDGMDLLLIEQPLAEDDLWDHSRLQPNFRTPLCLDESILSAGHARQALEMGACKIINIKAGRVAGISQAVQIHDVCVQHNAPVWCGGMLETGIGRAANLALASLPGFSLPGDISATERYYLEDITRERFNLNPDSTINVPDQPGLGISIDTEALERVTLAKLTLTS
jgi:O-succinylbenzoate synthase